LEDLFREVKPGTDMSLWKSNYAKWFLELATGQAGRQTPSDDDFDFVENCRARAAEAGYAVSDDDFRGAVIKGFLRTAIKEMGKGNGSLADYKMRRRKIAGRGFKIPRLKEISWFLEYAVLKRH
jgi:hypothetical protein